MRGLALFLALSGMAGAQSLAEYGAAAAGGATGGAAGKKVSEGITTIFGKMDKQAADAAKQGTSKPADSKPPQTAAPATTAKVTQPTEFQPSDTHTAPVRRSAKSADPSQVPEPPGETPVHRVAPKKSAPASLITAVPVPLLDLISLPSLPPPPVATPEALRTLARGATRADVLSLGFPSSRLSMYDDGHLGEVYGYTRDNVTFGVVRLSDGVVSSVEVR